jgi:adenine phosphoribosyltransferase
MKPYLRRIDTATQGNRYDVTPLFADAQCFAQLIEDLAAPFHEAQIDYVACIDALGFILGTAIAGRLEVGVIPIRKGGKLPVQTESVEFRDYSGNLKRLEIRKDALPSQSRVLLVDEWIETGSQVLAAATLLEAQGATVVGVASVNMDTNDRTEEIGKKYRVHTVWEAEQGVGD